MAMKPSLFTPKPSAKVAQKAGAKKCPKCGKSPCQCKMPRGKKGG